MSFLDDFQRCNFGQGVLHGDFAKWKNYQLNLSEIWSKKGATRSGFEVLLGVPKP